MSRNYSIKDLKKKKFTFLHNNKNAHPKKKNVWNFHPQTVLTPFLFLQFPSRSKVETLFQTVFHEMAECWQLLPKPIFFIYIFFFLGNPNKIDKEYNPLKFFFYIIFSEPLLFHSPPQHSVLTHPKLLFVP